MSTRIDITKEALDFLSDQFMIEEKEAEEVLQSCINLCHITSLPDKPAGEIPDQDKKLDELRSLGEEKRSVIYAILFREAGIGIQWWEESRAGERPTREGMTIPELIQAESEWNKLGLVLYRYYPSLSEAIEGETRRLEGKE